MAAGLRRTGSATVRPGDRDRILKTYRYLRVAMVVLAVVLATAVVAESVRSGRVLDSISAYYYTPARGVFVAALVAIGVGLVALQGRSTLADAALNLAGMLAPVVAFVPTTQGRPPGLDPHALDAEIDTGLLSLLVGGVVALALLIALAVSGRRSSTPMRPGDRIGVAAGVLLLLAGTAWYVEARDDFVSYAHTVAAAGMFAMIAVDVAVNSRTGRYRRLYATILALMLASQLAWLSVPLWDHAVLLVEAALITLFAVFWAVQTWELSGVDG